MNSELSSRVARLTIFGGLLVVGTGALVAEMGLEAGETRDALAVFLLGLAIGVPAALVGASILRGAAPAASVPVVASVVRLGTEAFPGGGFDIPMETDPSIELDIIVIPPAPVAPVPSEQWFVVDASGAFAAPRALQRAHAA